MAWALTYDGTTQSFEAWGLGGLSFQSQNFGVGMAKFTHLGGTYDGEPLFAAGEVGIIKLGETIAFQGKFASAKRSGKGIEENVTYTLRDAWHNLTRLFYLSPLALLKGFPKHFDGGASIAGLLESVIDYAAARGVLIQFGSATNLSVTPWEFEMEVIPCSEALSSLRKWCPDTTHYIDHTTTPPTIHFVRRADATALDLQLEDSADDVEIEALDDLLVSEVVFRYARTIQGEEGPVTDISTDVWPPGAEGDVEGAVIATFDLRGPQFETQELTTRNIASSSRAWWARFYPWVAPGNGDLVEGSGFGFTDTERLMQDSGGDWVNDSSGSVLEIEDGAVPHWEEANLPKQVLVKAVLNDFTLDGVHHDTYELQTTINATSLAGGVFTRETDDGESVPIGLAHAYYDACSVLHHAGQRGFTLPEITLPLPHCGNVVNLTGGEAAARGWTAMRAAIQSVQITVDAAGGSVSFGPPEHLGPQDLLTLSRSRGNTRAVLRHGPGGSEEKGSGGIRRAASNNTVPPKPTTTPGSGAFTVAGGGGDFTVTTGRVNGVAALAESVSGEEIEDSIDLSLEDGWIYIGINYNFTREEGYITGKTGPQIFIAKTTETDLADVEDKTEGNFVIGLAKIVDGEIAENSSIGRNARCMVAAAAIAEAEEQAAEIAVVKL